MANIFSLDEETGFQEPNEEEIERIVGKVSDWADEFWDSKYVNNLSDEEQYYIYDVVSYFALFNYSAFRIEPNAWDPEYLTIVTTEMLPTLLNREIYFYQAMMPVLYEFFSFLEEKKILKNAGMLKESVAGIRSDLNLMMADPIQWYSLIYVKRIVLENELEVEDDDIDESKMQQEIEKYVNEEDLKRFISESIERDENFEFEDFDDDDDDFDEDDDDFDEDDDDYDEDDDSDYDDEEESDEDEEESDSNSRKK